MATPMLSQLKQVRLMMVQATKAVAQMLDQPNLPATDLYATFQLKRMHEDMAAARKFLVWPSDYRSLKSEHELFIRDFTSLISGVLKQFNTLDLATDYPYREHRFWIIWELFTAACHGWTKWAETAQASCWEQLPMHPSFHTTLCNLMTWVLIASKHNSYAWIQLHVQKQAPRIIQLSVFLIVPCHCLVHVRNGRISSALETAGCSLPHNFISLLCCLVYEQLGIDLLTDLPTKAAEIHRWDVQARGDGCVVVTQLARAIASTVHEGGQNLGSPLINTLSTSAVIEFLKLAVVLEGEKSEPQPPPLSTYLAALARLVHNRANLKEDSYGDSVSISGDPNNPNGVVVRISSSGDSAGSVSPVLTATDSDLFPRSTVSQHRLLSVMCKGVSLDCPQTVERTRLMHAMLDHRDRDMDIIPSSADWCGTLALLTHNCSSRVLLWMQSFQTKEQRERHKPKLSLTALQQQQQGELDVPVKVMFDKQVLLLVQGIMVLASNTCLMAVSMGSKTEPVGQQTQQHQWNQLLLVNPELQALKTWCQMPGRITVLESLIRDPSSPSTVQTVETLIRHLALYSDMHDPEALPACISLAATLGKLLNTCMHSSDPQQQGLPSDPKLLHHIPGLITSIAWVFNSASAPGHPQHRSSSGRGVVSLGRARQRQTLPDSSSQPTQSLLQQQLKSVLLTIAVHLCHWHVQRERRRTIGPLTNSVRVWVEERKQECLAMKDCPTALLTQLLHVQVMSSLRPQAEVGNLLGQHALTHFHGRLLPGCCHLRCINLSGPGEAVLHTLLCSGCRRARYCSPACQKAAWFEGGHAKVCVKTIT